MSTRPELQDAASSTGYETKEPGASNLGSSALQDAVDPISDTESSATLYRLDLGSVRILSLDVQTDSGRIEIVGHDRNEVSAEVIDYEPSSAQIELRLKGDEIQFRTHPILQPKRFWRALVPPPVGLRVAVPRNVMVRAVSGRGSIRVLGFAGDVVIITRDGQIEVDGPCRSVAIESESGNARLVGQRGGLIFRSESGSIDASWQQCQTKGGIDIKTNRGSVDLSFPADSRIESRFTMAGPTEIVNEFANAADAVLKLVVVTKKGAVSVRKARGDLAAISSLLPEN